jgi:C-terminal processing protease CtpA/Prc
MGTPLKAQSDPECDNFWAAAYVVFDKHVDNLTFQDIVLRYLNHIERAFNIGLQVTTGKDKIIITDRNSSILELACHEFSELALRRLLEYLQPRLIYTLSKTELSDDLCEYMGDFLISTVDRDSWAVKNNSAKAFSESLLMKGVIFRSDDSTGGYRVMSISETAISYSSGLRKGDVIVQVQSLPSAYLGYGYFRKLMLADVGDTVSVTVQRGKDLHNLELIPDKSPSKEPDYKSVAVRLMDEVPNTGYIRLGWFDLESERVIKEFIVEYQDRLEHLILDARYSTGGVMSNIRSLNEYLFGERDTLWVEYLTKFGEYHEKYGYNCNIRMGVRESLNRNLNVIILTSDRTSSGAEMFLIPFIELRNARTYGAQTIGAMSVNRSFFYEFGGTRYSYNTTVGRLVSPSLAISEGNGIRPDVLLPNGQDALQFVLDELKGN